MPIEIRELHIKVTVEEPASDNRQRTIPAADRDNLISDCVDQVMEILNNKTER